MSRWTTVCPHCETPFWSDKLLAKHIEKKHVVLGGTSGDK